MIQYTFYLLHTYKFSRYICIFWGYQNFRIFTLLLLRIIMPLNIHRFREHSSDIQSRNLCLAMHLCQNCLQEISQSTNTLKCVIVSLISVGLSKAASLVTTFRTASAAAAVKLKHTITNCKSHKLVAIHVYPTLQSMQAKVLPIKCRGWKFCRQPVDYKNLKITFLKNLHNLVYVIIQYI